MTEREKQNQSTSNEKKKIIRKRSKKKTGKWEKALFCMNNKIIQQRRRN